MKLKLRSFLVLLVVAALPMMAIAQVKENSAWVGYFGSAKLSDKWGLHLDVQARSGDDLEYVRNLLIRPGVIYHLGKRTNLTAGYLLNNTYSNTGGNTLNEHRIWEQFIYTQPIRNATLQHRFRLEQRFIERPVEDVFSQRLRYFARAIVPLKSGAPFTKGAFLAVQDEVFLNLQNKDQLNGSTFDQNRAFLALGYRPSPKMEVEAGYMNQYIKGAPVNTTNYIVQLALYMRF